MKRVAAIGALLPLALLAAKPAASTISAPPLAVDGIALGSDVRAAIAARGAPDVVNTDVGHVWTWNAAGPETLRVLTDGNGRVQLVDVTNPPAAPVIPHAARPAQIATGVLPESGTTANLWDFPLAGGAELILAYGLTGTAADGSLQEVFLGERDALQRLGLVQNGPPPASFTAPVLDRLGAADVPPGGPRTAFVRVVVAPDGGVREATIFVTSGDAQFDAVALASARNSGFTPATRDGKPVAAVYFRRDDLVAPN